MITISIVSHSHSNLVSDLLNDLKDFGEISKIIITKNIKENSILVPQTLNKKIKFIENDKPKGFGSNHNYAANYCETVFFCVLNPDISFDENPFPMLIKTIKQGASICTPAVLNSKNEIDDHVRKFPSFLTLLGKLVKIKDKVNYKINDEVFSSHWVAGMFMFFNYEHFKKLKGFDESFFLYYEDVDLCKRAKNLNFEIKVCPKVYVKHFAQRDSHKKLKFFIYHVKSLFKYLFKIIFFRYSMK